MAEAKSSGPMGRREFLVAAAATCAGAACAAAAETAKAPDARLPLAAPCGLYCGICRDNLVNKECHGCGCACGRCAGAAHQKGCAIARCVAERKLGSCAECEQLPCTRLIQFANDPIWRTHGPVIENLRRRKAIGTAAWAKEQEEYWADKDARQRWLELYLDCEKRWQASRRGG